MYVTAGLLEYHVVSAIASERIIRRNTTRQLHLLDMLIDGLVSTILNAHRLPILHALRVILQFSLVDLPLLFIVLIHGPLCTLENIVRLLLSSVYLLRSIPQVTQHFTITR